MEDFELSARESILPGKKELQEKLRAGDLSLVMDMAEEQEKLGASILDVNMGMNGIDEKEMMLRAVNELTMTVDLPLSIDSSYVDVVESALRIYPGRALINSISLEPEKFEKLIPIQKNTELCLFCFLCRMPDFKKIWMRKKRLSIQY